MTRTFHNAPGVLFALSATMLIVASGYFLWVKMAVPALVLILIAILHIERTIHTEYVIDDSSLTISRGRLSRTMQIPLEQIATANVFRPTPLLFLIPRTPIVVIILRAKPRPILITPVNPDEFVKTLWTKTKH